MSLSYINDKVGSVSVKVSGLPPWLTKTQPGLVTDIYYLTDQGKLDQGKLVTNIYLLLTRENDKKRKLGELVPRAKKGRDKFSIKQMEKQDTTFFEISAVDDQHLAIQKSWITKFHSDTL